MPSCPYIRKLPADIEFLEKKKSVIKTPRKEHYWPNFIKKYND